MQNVVSWRLIFHRLDNFEFFALSSLCVHACSYYIELALTSIYLISFPVFDLY